MSDDEFINLNDFDDDFDELDDFSEMDEFDEEFSDDEEQFIFENDEFDE